VRAARYKLMKEVQISTSTEDGALAALHTTEQIPVLKEHDSWRKENVLPLPGIEQRLHGYPSYTLVTTPTVLYTFLVTSNIW